MLLASRSVGLASVLALVGACTVVACSSGSDGSVSSTGPGAQSANTAAAVHLSESSLPNTLSRPTWATTDRFAGNLADTDQVNVQVHLKLHNYQDAVDELYAVSDPSNAKYGQFLSNDDFSAKYAPTADDVAAVRAHLETNGLTVSEVGASNLYIQAHGTAAQVAKTFSSKLGHYNVKGTMRRAPVDVPTLPGDILNRVAGVLGLADSTHFQTHGVRVGGVKPNSGKFAPKADETGGACSEWFGQNTVTPTPAFGGGFPDQIPTTTCGYTPPQIRSAYGLSSTVNGGNDGKGVTVAIIDAYESPTLLKDAQTYFAHNDADHPLLDSQFKIVEVPPQLTDEPPVDTGWYGEQTLDVEAIHATAPGANIVYTAAASPYDQDLIAAINTIVNQKLATMISNSYGSPEGQANDFVVWQQTVLQAGLKGVGVYFSSGDNSDESVNMGFPDADFPASLPHVTAVGGTSLALGQQGQLLWETGWETGGSWLTNMNADADAGPDGAAPPADWQYDPPAPGELVFGGGGGVSLVYDQPRYQKGVVPDAIANGPGAPARALPDVGMLGDPLTGYLIGETDPDSGVYSESPIGGTSLACPLFVGTMALAQQHAKHTLGFANAQLYKAQKKAFRDLVAPASPQAVALYNGAVIATMNFQPLSISMATGWDTETGLGAPNGAAFVKNIK